MVVFLLSSDVGAQATYSVSITIQGLPAGLNTNVYVDGAFNGTLSGGQTRTFTFTASTTHIVTVDFYLPSSTGANGTRYSNKETSRVFSTAGSHVFSYIAQYYLSVETTYSSVAGEGWYDSGSVARATLKESEISEGPGIRHVFAGWAGDASGNTPTSNDIFMNGAKGAVARWKTQFYLTIETDPPQAGSPKGSGWYDAGSQANILVPTVVPATEDTRLKFTHWSGAYPEQSPSANVLMDRPKVVKAHYLAQYLLTIQYDPFSIQTDYNETRANWYDAQANVQLGPAPTTIDLSSVERLRFVGWRENDVASSSVSVTVLMDKPHRIVLSYKTQFYVDVRSAYGSVSGSGWYDKGSVAKIAVVGTSGTWPISYRLDGWRVDPSSGKLTGTDDSWILTVDGPYVVEAQWSVDFLPIIELVGAIGVAVALVAAGLIIAHKRGIFSRAGTMPTRLRPTGIGATRVCSSCGSHIPASATFCQKCGTSQVTVGTASLDEKVYDYILKHEGVISLSRASRELGISVEKIKEVSEKLKKEGRLA